MKNPTIGVSACLLGQPVRYDGGHKRDDVVIDHLGPEVRFVAVCPEVELGLGTPRETLRLVLDGSTVRLVMANGEDHTESMRRYAEARVAALEAEDLDGYVLKARSPSCGMGGVPRFQPDGSATTGGRGLFAAALLERYPDLPVVEETDLTDPDALRQFIERVRAYRRAKDRKR